jgi:hypothetical protein
MTCLLELGLSLFNTVPRQEGLRNGIGVGGNVARERLLGPETNAADPEARRAIL